MVGNIISTIPTIPCSYTSFLFFDHHREGV
jgi:hypothetical protein